MTESSTPALSDALDTPENTEADDTVPIAVWRSVDRHFADALYSIRRCRPFADLALGPWAILVQIAIGWVRGGTTATQLELAALAGCSERTLRRTVAELSEAGILATVREGTSVGYALGPVLETILREFAAYRDPRIWTRGTWLAQREPVSLAGNIALPVSLAGNIALPVSVAGSKPVSVAGSTIEPVSVAGKRSSGPAPIGDVIARNLQRVRPVALLEPSSPSKPVRVAGSIAVAPSELPLIKKKKLNDLPSSLPEKGTPSSATAPTPLAPLDLATLHAAACRALAARYRIGFPGHSPPTTFPTADVDKLVNVTEHTTLTVAELDQLHLDAIAGASPKSKKQPPAVAFIWGNRDYFLQNARDGRAKREAAMRPAKLRPKPKEPDEPPATLAELEEIGRRGQALLSGPAPHETTRPKNTRFLP